MTGIAFDEGYILRQFTGKHFFHIRRKGLYPFRCGIRAVRGGRPHQCIRLTEGIEIGSFVTAMNDNHRVFLAQQDEVHQQSGNTPVAVLEGVDADVTVMEQRGKLYGRILVGVGHTVVPSHEVVHEGRSFFGRGIVETLSRRCDDGVRTGLVAARMYRVACTDVAG